MNIKTLFQTACLICLITACSKEELQRPVTGGDLLPEYNFPGMPVYDAEALAKELDEPAFPILTRSDDIVELPAGSKDALAAAIAEAGEGGIVLVKAGDHNESEMVTISRAVRIIGEPGARLIAETTASDIVGTFEFAIYVYNTSGVIIQGLEIVPSTAPGGTAILLENAPGTTIRNNVIKGHENSILIEKSNGCKIFNNIIAGTDGWQTGEVFNVLGITNINGRSNWLVGNEVSNCVFGIWACDKGGYSISNETDANLIGQILCNVPAGAFPLPSGNVAGSETPGEGWLVQNNSSAGNFDAGYLVIDGANNNYLVGNKGTGNGTYDIELTTDTERFGFLTPGSYGNWVAAFKNQIVKDCGDDNRVIGGDLVDNDADPCY